MKYLKFRSVAASKLIKKDNIVLKSELCHETIFLIDAFSFFGS